MRVLVCNVALHHRAGSEIHCFELAQHLIAKGHSVTAAAFSIGEPMASEFARLGAPIVPLDSGQIAAEWDLIWTHHVPCFAEVHARRRLSARRHVHGLLSSVLPIERVPFPRSASIDKRHFTLLANAPLTASVAKPLLPDGMRINILWNLAPVAWQLAEDRKRDKLRKIAVVSAHPPPEVFNLRHLAERRGIEMQFYGDHPRTRVRLTPAILTSFDAVITIGKTVQYCLAAGIPVFVYDYFGGPGWLNRVNIAAAEEHIYSGKCTRTPRPAEVLWDELAAGFEDAVRFHRSRRGWAAERYDIGRQLERLRLLNNYSKPSPVIADHDDATARAIIAFAEETPSSSVRDEEIKKILAATRFH